MFEIILTVDTEYTHETENEFLITVTIIGQLVFF